MLSASESSEKPVILEGSVENTDEEDNTYFLRIEAVQFGGYRAALPQNYLGGKNKGKQRGKSFTRMKPEIRFVKVTAEDVERPKIRITKKDVDY